MLNSILPVIINKLGSDFTKESFANEFAKLDSISGVQISNNEIHYNNKKVVPTHRTLELLNK